MIDEFNTAFGIQILEYAGAYNSTVTYDEYHIVFAMEDFSQDYVGVCKFYSGNTCINTSSADAAEAVSRLTEGVSRCEVVIPKAFEYDYIDYLFSELGNDEKLSVLFHEMGHALMLCHVETEIYSIMQQGLNNPYKTSYITFFDALNLQNSYPMLFEN